MAAEPQRRSRPALDVLPETAAVHWRPRVDDARLRRVGALWTLTTVAHVVPFVGAAALLMWLNPLALPVALACVAHAWVIPELYAQRGANVVRPRARAAAEPERRSVGLLGDLVDHDARELHARPASCSSPAGSARGSWARAARCCCAGGACTAGACTVDSRVEGASALPSGDRIAHLLLALRADEQGFATVANLSFSGARWRLRRRVGAPMRPAVHAAETRAGHAVHRSSLNPGHPANAALAARVHDRSHARLRRSHPPHPRTGHRPAAHRSSASGPSLQDGPHGSRQSCRSDDRPLRAPAPELRLTHSRPALARWPARYA